MFCACGWCLNTSGIVFNSDGAEGGGAEGF